ncbi:MAG: ATP-binding cassette domain-containing protein [Planctomycetota bacterium]
MIEVHDLWKSYGRAAVLRGISFSVPTGTITGFLGPNGAGKTTTMRTLTTFFPVERGRVLVAGHDVSAEPRAVCRKVGYLPESWPIYPELRVEEFLRHRATLRGLPPNTQRSKIDSVVLECGLQDVRRKLLGALSRGYRQRLGLADTLLHDPEVLILDEPTAGLDPRQVVEVRKLIESFRGRRTVLLSSHVLGEVELICDRVIILHGGVVKAHEDRARWQERLGSNRLRLVLESAPANAVERIRQESGVLEVVGAAGSFDIRSDRDVRAALSRLAAREGWTLLELTPLHVTLENLFLDLTAEPADRRAS